MRIGAIIRSTGERTEHLCKQSLQRELDETNIHVIKDISPFIETLRVCYKTALDEKFDWYLLVDADMIMVENWGGLLRSTLDSVRDSTRLWEVTFRLKDFIEGRDVDALHVVKGAYSSELLASVDAVSDGLKPEGKVRDDMIKRTGAKRLITKKVIAFHGYEQYLRDIFNRFYNRACRDSSYADKFKIFNNLNSEDKRVAKAGWDYGLANNNLASLDSRLKVEDMSQFGFKERSHIRFKLDKFYQRVR